MTTPATTDAEQAERADLLVLRCLHMADPGGTGADPEEVRDLLILCHGMDEAGAARAMADAEAHGLLSPGA